MKVLERPPNQTSLLVQAFGTFTKASASLEKTYLGLHEQVLLLSEKLERSNYYLASVLTSLPCGVLVVDSQRQVTTMNPAARQLLSADGLTLPSPLDQLFQGANFSNRGSALNETPDQVTEITLAGPSATVLLCSWSQMREGERVLVVQDVTEMRSLESRIAETEKAAVKGDMALQLAHEIRNPLAALELFAELLESPEPTSEERRRYLANIRLGVRTLDAVLTNMLLYSRTSERAEGQGNSSAGGGGIATGPPRDRCDVNSR